MLIGELLAVLLEERIPFLLLLRSSLGDEAVNILGDGWDSERLLRVEPNRLLELGDVILLQGYDPTIVSLLPFHTGITRDVREPCTP